MNNLAAFQNFMQGIWGLDDSAELPPVLIHQAILFEPDVKTALAKVDAKRSYELDARKPKELTHEEKHCRACGKPKVQRKNEGDWHFKTRKCCSIQCVGLMKVNRLSQDKIDAIQAMARTSQYTIHEIAQAMQVSVCSARKYANAIGYWGMSAEGKPVWVDPKKPRPRKNKPKVNRTNT